MMVFEIGPLFLCSVFGLQALLGSSAAWGLTASTLFDSPPAGEDGSCDPRDVGVITSEAPKLVQNAINAIDTSLEDETGFDTENEILANTPLAPWNEMDQGLV